MDRFKIDSHKLMYHIPRLYDWLKKGDTFPIYAEVGLYGGCNQRCIFCALDYLGYRPNILEQGVLRRFISEAAENGLKSIMYASEGEPLLHPNVAEIIAFTKKRGVDAAVTSNASVFLPSLAERCLPYLSWFRASINAGRKETYARIHRSKKQVFEQVLDNLAQAVKIRDKNGYRCVIGAQFLLLPQNHSEAPLLAARLKEAGLDYLIIKPYSRHVLSNNRIPRSFREGEVLGVKSALEKFSGEGFQVIFRSHAMKRVGEGRLYARCSGLPFVTFITAKGDIYPCHMFFGRKAFSFGNIYDNNFSLIWRGRKRKEVMKRIEHELDIRGCREACRLDAINRYLWELKHGGEHFNFI